MVIAIRLNARIAPACLGVTAYPVPKDTRRRVRSALETTAVLSAKNVSPRTTLDVAAVVTLSVLTAICAEVTGSATPTPGALTALGFGEPALTPRIEAPT